MKHIVLFLLVSFIAACAAETSPDRLPEPTGQVQDPRQWTEYCERQEFDDPACKEQ